MYNANFTLSTLNSSSFIDCNFKTVVFNNAKILNSLYQNVVSVGLIRINTPISKTLLISNRGFEPMENNAEILTSINQLLQTRDLSSMNLSFVDLSGRTMENIDFSNSILMYSNFEGATCRDCSFENAKLIEANLTNASL